MNLVSDHPNPQIAGWASEASAADLSRSFLALSALYKVYKVHSNAGETW